MLQLNHPILVGTASVWRVQGTHVPPTPGKSLCTRILQGAFSSTSCRTFGGRGLFSALAFLFLTPENRRSPLPASVSEGHKAVQPEVAPPASPAIDRHLEHPVTMGCFTPECVTWFTPDVSRTGQGLRRSVPRCSRRFTYSGHIQANTCSQ